MTIQTPKEALDKINECRKLKRKKLNLGDCRLTSIPKELADMTWLTKLDLSFNQITKIEGLENLTNLTILWLSSNQITKIEGLESLTNLTELNLSSNQITKIDVVENLTNLIYLNLSSNQIIKIESVENLTNLTCLQLSSNQITKIDVVKNLTNLTQLWLDSNQITQIEGIENLINLNSLSLFSNQLTKIEGIENLINLTRLDLSHNQLTKIEGIEKLINLTRLYLSSNQLTKIEGIENLINLTQLYLSYNQLTKIEGIENLINLNSLYLHSNQITKIDGIEKLINLNFLLLYSNQITDLSPLVPFIKKGLNIKWGVIRYNGEDSILLKDNPLLYPDIETVQRGNEAILAYFENIEAQKEQLENIYEGKLLIVGDGGAGKTSLLRKLLDEKNELPKEDETTKGIDIQHYTFKADDGKTFKLHLWDFGGQEIYHATHQFFLTKRSLYCMVDDTRKDDKNANDPIFNYWLQTAKLYGDKSPMLIVQNEKGERSKQLEMNSIRSRYDFVKDSFATNLDTCRGLASVKKEIEHIVQNLPHARLLFAKDELEVRKKLEEIATTKNDISLEKYEEICIEKGLCIGKEVDEKRAIFLLRRLHDLGVVLYFENEPLLQNTIILKNTWATKAVYSLLDSEKIKGKKGFFDESDLENAWTEPEFKKKRTILLALMEQFQLCYLLPDTARKTWLAPQLLNAEPPENFIWDESGALRLRYKYEFMPKGIFSRFIVRMHRYVKEVTKAWRSGVVLERQGSEAFVTETYGAQEILIKAKGTYAKELLTLIAEDFDKMHGNIEGLVVDKMVPCICRTCQREKTPHEYNYQELLERKERKKRTIECAKPDYEDVEVQRLLDGIFTQVVEKEEDTKVKKKTIKLFLASSNELAEERKEFEIFISRENKKLHQQNIFIDLEIWEDQDDSIHETGKLQNRYNEVIEKCDIFVLLFFTKVGKYSDEEFEVALNTFKAKGKPKVYTYFKNADIKTGNINRQDLSSLLDFQDKLKEMDHFVTHFSNTEDLLLQFTNQLDKYFKAVNRTK